MKDVPSNLQCAYCIRNKSHGGECTTQKSYYDAKGCLAFKLDERGCIRNADTKIKVHLYYKFPPLKTWDSEWEFNGIDTQIRINRIYGLDWDAKKGKLIVYCEIDYFVNEYHENYKETDKKPIFKVIK